jgi:hypothetical protein
MGRGSTLDVTADQVVAYRVAAHNLHERLPAHDLARAAATCGIQDTPPGNAAVGLAARVVDLVPDDLDVALFDERSLVRVLGPRGAAHIVPSSDAPVFGAAVLATDEESLQEQLAGSWPSIESREWTAREALGVVIGVLSAVVADGEARTKGELSDVLHGRVPVELEPWCDGCDAHHVPDQLLRLAGVAGVFCYGRSEGRRQLLVGMSLWLGEPPGSDLRAARADLVRRFVHAYGPVAPRHFAGWTGLSQLEARDRFQQLTDELVEVRVDGAPAWVLAEDLAALDDPPLASGARLLPGGDPFLHQRDRSTLIADKATQRAVWRPAGRPGLVLVTGHPVATWRARVVKGHLALEVDPFEELGARKRAAVRQEAEVLVPFRGADEVDVTFLSP